MSSLVKANSQDHTALDIAHKDKYRFSQEQRLHLLEERQQLIDQCIQEIETSFFAIGKALAEIKHFKLYKADPVYKTWSEFVKHRITHKLHQSTISDYISIVTMQLENKDFIGKDELLQLGYKKARLLKTKYNQIKKIKDDKKRETLTHQFKNFYKQSFEELAHLPFTTYEKRFDFIKTKPRPSQKETITLGLMDLEYNPQHHQLVLKSEYPQIIEDLYQHLQSLGPNGSVLDIADKIKTVAQKSKEQMPEIVILNKKKDATPVDHLKLHTFLKRIPKTEIHLHAEALVSVDTIFFLNQKYRINPDIKTKDDVHSRFKITNLSQMIDFFLFFQSTFKSEEDFDLLIKDIEYYLRRNRIFYAEVFLSPTGFLKNGLQFELLLGIIEKAIDRLEQEHHIQLKLLIDVSRSFGPDNAMRNLDHVLEYKGKHILGIGLGGAESKGPPKEYQKVFEKALSHDLRVVAHAGEEVGPVNIWTSLLDLKVSRIGHGTSAMYDEELRKYLRDHQIPLEICPTSNVVTRKYVKQLSQHPVRSFFDEGLYITINTDDPMIFGVEIPDEYMNLYTHLNFTVSELCQLIKNNVYASFLPASQKDIQWEIIENTIHELQNEIFTPDEWEFLMNPTPETTYQNTTKGK